MGCWELTELILSSIYFAFCFTSFIWRLTKPDKGNTFIEYEMWAIMAEMVYYALFLLIGFKSFFSKSEEKEKESNNGFQKFLKNIVFKYLWPFVMNSVVIFYLGYFFKWFNLDTKNKGNDFWLSLFQHGFSQIGFIIDLILFKREYKDTHFFDFLVISAIYVGYCALLFMIKPEIKTYNFLYKDELRPDNSYLLSLMIVCYFVYLYMYFFYMYVVKFKSGVRNLFWGEDKEQKKDENEKDSKKGKSISLIDDNKGKEESGEENEENKIN